MKKIIVAPEHDNYKIGDYLKEVLNYSSRRIRNLELFINGKKVKTLSKKIRKLNRILIIEKEKETNIRAIEMPLDIVFEDENLVIINKEVNLVVHPTQKKTDLTLANGLVFYFYKTLKNNTVPRFFNRLDMNTTGLIIATKNAYSQHFLQTRGNVSKKYFAFSHGIIEEDEFIIDFPIGKIGDELRRVELKVENGGQEARTKVKVIKRYYQSDITFIELELFTGRTHQIRAHLSIISHPLVGDELYGGIIDGKFENIKRQLLHSYYLSFVSPTTEKIENIVVDLPKDMKNFKEILEDYENKKNIF